MLAYINGIVNQEVLEDLRERLKGISTDQILGTGMLNSL